MAKVLLGMPGPWANDYRELSDPFTTKIGGIPDWPLPKDSINTDLLLCATCSGSLSLVAQVYAPLSHHHRILFIFGCVSPKCTTVWRVLRLQKLVDVDISQHKQQVEVQNSNSRDDEDESEDEDDMSFEELAEALFQAGTLASSNSKSKSKKQQKKRQHNFPTSSPYPEPTTASEDVNNHNDIPVVPCFYIYTQEEPSTGGLSSVCSSYSSLSIKENGNSVEDNMQAEETWEKEQYEYDKALTADRTYLKFKKRLDGYPEQCFRYSHGGKPILAVGDEINPGSCGLCGRPRQFEMQLMPPLLYFLQEALDDNQRQMVENWDWMTLLVLTCPESCCEEIKQVKSNREGWIIAEEAVVAQCEESMPTQLGYFS
uniref:Programmed cell death protein 2 C-terminal domain-containing protein n=1 Tax=Medicago truncatula TaxID=3880 RepID=I3T3H5_MEDTR|nr:unknown [Medicago truncatula]